MTHDRPHSPETHVYTSTSGLGAAENPTDTNASENVRYNLERRYEQTRGQLEAFNERAAVFVRENPVVSIVGAVTLGYVVGRLASRRWLV